MEHTAPLLSIEMHFIFHFTYSDFCFYQTVLTVFQWGKKTSVCYLTPCGIFMDYRCSRDCEFMIHSWFNLFGFMIFFTLNIYVQSSSKQQSHLKLEVILKPNFDYLFIYSLLDFIKCCKCVALLNKQEMEKTKRDRETEREKINAPQFLCMRKINIQVSLD